MKLKRIIAVHHGRYDAAGLTSEGVDRIQLIAGAIKKELGSDSTVRLLTSPRRHAIQAAKIIGETIGVTPNLCIALQIDYLNYEIDISMQHDVILHLAESCDTIITVSHAKTQRGIIHASSGIIPKKKKGCAMLHCTGVADVTYFPE